MTKQYRFTIETNKVGSTVDDVVELHFDDEATQEEINQQVDEVYQLVG
jgi:hypothetical protein